MLKVVCSNCDTSALKLIGSCSFDISDAGCHMVNAIYLVSQLDGCQLTEALCYAWPRSFICCQWRPGRPNGVWWGYVTRRRSSFRGDLGPGGNWRCGLKAGTEEQGSGCLNGRLDYIVFPSIFCALYKKLFFDVTKLCGDGCCLMLVCSAPRDLNEEAVHSI